MKVDLTQLIVESISIYLLVIEKLILSSRKNGLSISGRMFEPRHIILSNVRADIRNYVVSWLKHSA